MGLSFYRKSGDLHPRRRSQRLRRTGVVDALNKVDLKVIKMGTDEDGNQVHVDKDGKPVQDNKDKVLQDFATKKDGDSKTQSSGTQSNEYYGNNSSTTTGNPAK